jgi:hypothetical protein
MRQIFRDGLGERAKHQDEITVVGNKDIPEFEESNFGGHADFDKFSQILGTICLSNAPCKQVNFLGPSDHDD